MGSEHVRSMVPALTFGTAKSKVEVKAARRGKISLRGSGVFTLDELAQVVEQIGTWVRQQQDVNVPSFQPLPTFQPSPLGRPSARPGSNDFQGGPSALDVVTPGVQG